jgi:hypothetical protein
METKQAAADALISVAAGFAGSKVMEPVTKRLYQWETDEAKKTEQEASYGVAYNVAVKKTAGLVGVELSEEQVKKAGKAVHYGLGIAWAPVYMWLRRSTNLTPWGAGLAAGASMYAVVDEALNPLLGFTPPPQAFPPVTHLRGLIGHLVFGLGLAAAVEAGWRLIGGRPAGRT